MNQNSLILIATPQHHLLKEKRTENIRRPPKREPHWLRYLAISYMIFKGRVSGSREPQTRDLSTPTQAGRLAKVFMLFSISLTDHLDLSSKHHQPRTTVYNQAVFLITQRKHVTTILTWFSVCSKFSTLGPDTVGLTSDLLLPYCTNTRRTMVFKYWKLRTHYALNRHVF